MGIIITSILLLVFGILAGVMTYSSDKNKQDLLCGFFFGFFISVVFFCFAAPVKTSVTSSNYFCVVGAKTVLETETSLNLNNNDIIMKSLEAIDDYNKRRADIKKNSDRFWDGVFYNTNSLAVYPEVTVDSLTLAKFK